MLKESCPTFDSLQIGLTRDISEISLAKHRKNRETPIQNLCEMSSSSQSPRSAEAFRSSSRALVSTTGYVTSFFKKTSIHSISWNI